MKLEGYQINSTGVRTPLQKIPVDRGRSQTRGRLLNISKQKQYNLRMAEAEQKKPTITYGSIISISHLQDDDALIAGDGFIKRSVILKGMSPYVKSHSKKFQLDHFKNMYMSNCLFIVCPKFQNPAKRQILNEISNEDDDGFGAAPGEEIPEPETASPTKKDEFARKGSHLDEVQIRQYQVNLFNEYKYNVESFEKEKQLEVTYEQQIQLIHLASSKFLACHQKEAKYENNNYKLQLDPYPSEATLFRIIPAFKYQKDGDQIIYASEVVRIIRSSPLLNKVTYVHCSGEILDVKKNQIKAEQKRHQKGEMKIQKREVNASLEETTSWKMNLFSEHVPDSLKLLKIGDIVWLHHSERNATLAALRQSKAFDRSKFHSLDLREWLSLENLTVGIQPSGVSESSYEQYVGNTYSMWVIESGEYLQGGVVQYERLYRLKHFSSGLYLAVGRPQPEQAPKKATKKDPYAVKKEQKDTLPKEYISQKDPPAKFVLQTVPDRNSLFEFVALKPSDAEHRYIKLGAFIYLKNVENKKYIDVVSKLEEGDSKASTQKSHLLSSYLKPTLKNEKEKSEQSVFKLYKADPSECWEVMFLDSCSKQLLQFLFYISGYQWKGDAQDAEYLKMMDKKLSNSIRTVKELDDFLNQKVYNSLPEQKYGHISSFRQSLLRQQLFIDVLIKVPHFNPSPQILQESITKNELEMWQNRKRVLKEIEEEAQEAKKNEKANPRKRQKEVSKKELVEFIIKKVDLCIAIYQMLISVCKNNYENQIYIYDLLPYFQIHTKFIPGAVTFMIELVQYNMTLLLRLSDNLRIDFDYATHQAIQEDMSKKIKVLINLYEKDPTPPQQPIMSLTQSQYQQPVQTPNPNQIAFKTHEKIRQKPLNLINFFFNILWDENSPNKEEYLRFLRSICRHYNQSVQINQENLYKLYKKFNDAPEMKMLGIFTDEGLQDAFDGRMRMKGNELEIPMECDRRQLRFIAEQLQFFSEVSFGRNYIWKNELVKQFPQQFLFRSIWRQQTNIRLQELRPLWCKMSISLYVDHQPLRRIILPTFCRLFKHCDHAQRVDIFEVSAKALKPKSVFHSDNKNEFRDHGLFKNVYSEFIEELLQYLEYLKTQIMGQIDRCMKVGQDLLNDQLVYNTAELLLVLLQLDVFEFVDESQITLDQYYMRIIEPLIYLIQYDKKNLKFLKASVRSVEGEIKKNKEKKEEKFNPLAMKMQFNPLALGSMLMGTKDDAKEKKPQEENDNFNESQELDDNQIFGNPIMRGFISLNNQLESLTYQEYSQIRTEIEFKLKICSILDHFLDRRQNFLISNLIIFFRKRVLKDTGINHEKEEQEDAPLEDEDAANGSKLDISPEQLKLQKLIDDFLLGLIPNVARTGIKEIDYPEKEVKGAFPFMNMNLNVFEEKHPERFTNYFKEYKVPAFTESYDLDQLLSLKAGDEHVNEEPVAAVLPFLLGSFFFVHDELLEERVLNVTMRVFNQREELKANLHNLQVLFDDEKTKLYEYIERQMVRLTELIERSEIWLSEFNRKTGPIPAEMEECEGLISNMVRGFGYNLTFTDENITNVSDEIDPSKQSVMNFLKVHVPITELIKTGFHVLVEIMLDSMFPPHKKQEIVNLFTQAYRFLTNFVANNRANQMVAYEDIESFQQYLHYNVGQIQLIKEIFRDNYQLLTTKVDYLLIQHILNNIDHEGRQECFLEILTVLLKCKNKYLFDNQLLILNTFLPLRPLTDIEVKMLYADGMKGKQVQFYVEDTYYEHKESLFERLRDVDWKDTYRDEPFYYHSSLLNMLIQTTLIQADRRQYDPSIAVVNFRDNFNISVVKLKKMFSAESLIEMLKQPDDMVDIVDQAMSNVISLVSGSRQEDLGNPNEKKRGFTTLKPQLCEFLRLVHITSDKRPPQNMEISHLQREMAHLIEIESMRLEKISSGRPFTLAYVDYLVEGFLPLLISFHERVLMTLGSQNYGDLEQEFIHFSDALARCIDTHLYEELQTQRQARIIHKFATFYENRMFRKLVLSFKPNLQPSPSMDKMQQLLQGQYVDESTVKKSHEISQKLIDRSAENMDESNPLIRSPATAKPKKTLIGGMFGGASSFFKMKGGEDSKPKNLAELKEFDQGDLLVIEDSWHEFLGTLLESKTFQEQVEFEKQVLADAIINVEKLISKEQAETLESKPNIDMVIKKFINFLQYAVKQPKNKSTVVTLLKIMRKIIEKEKDPEKIKALQEHFDKLGATKMVLLVLSEHAKSLNQEMLLHILYFINTMLSGGNQRVQKAIFDYFVAYQKSETVFQTFAEIIKNQIVNIEIRSKERKFQSTITVSDGSKDDSVIEHEQDESDSSGLQELVLNQVLQFLQNCVEGHYLELQNYIRFQTNSRSSYDMINLIADLLKTYYYEERTVRQYDNMIKCLDTLNELVQGPCLENQIAVAESRFFDIVQDIFPLKKPTIMKQGTKKSSGSSRRRSSSGSRKQKSAPSSEPIEPWMVAHIQNKVLVLVLSLLEMREIKGKNSMVRRIMRNLPFNVLERHMTIVYKNVNSIYKDEYLLDSLDHLKVDPRDLSPQQLKQYHKNYFKTIIQNGQHIFALMLYYFESGESFDSPIVNMHWNYLKNVVRREAGGLFAPNSTLGQLLALVLDLIEQSYLMAQALSNATLGKLKGQISEEEILARKNKLKIEERKRRLRKSFNFFMSNTVHIEIVRNDNLEIVFFPLLPHCKCLPKDQKTLFQENVERTSVKAKVQGLVGMSEEYIQIMVHEEAMKRFYKKYPIIGFFANYIQLWKDISYYLTLVLNIFIIGSFAVFNADGTTTATVYQRLHEYNFFRKIDWTQQETERLFLGLGITMTICSLFVVIFFLAKIAPLIIKRAWAQPALIERPKPGYTIRLINLLFKLFFILFSCLADFEVLYYLGYGVMAVVGTLIHPFFYSFHLSVILIRYPTLKNVVRSITEPKEQLILTLVLMLVLTYIYTLVAYLTVQDDFYGQCHSVLYCFLYSFDQNGKVPGGIGGTLTQDHPNPQYSVARFLSDAINNLLIVIIMTNIVMGIIIDTFGSLREQENEKQSDIRDICFICGLENVVFERKSDGSTGGFQNHIRVNHYMWNYLYYIAYLDWKDPQDYSGIESYVAQKLADTDLLWIPFNKAIELADLNDDEAVVQRRQVTGISENVQNMVENAKNILKAIKLKDKKA